MKDRQTQTHGQTKRTKEREIKKGRQTYRRQEGRKTHRKEERMNE